MRAKGLISLLFMWTALNGWDGEIPFDSGRWSFQPDKGKIVDYLGRRALQLQGGQAIVTDSVFTDGVIEFDIAFSGERGFMGVLWRVREDGNYEEFYLRPHQTGQVDANQYTPVFNGMSGWQLYHGEGYGAPVDYHFNRWMPVKIVVSGNSAEIYVKDMDQPLLFVPELKHETHSGKVGLNAGRFAPGYFSNFRFRAGSPVLKNKAKPEPVKTPDAISNWSVSQPFAESSLDETYRLDPSWTKKLSWQPLATESWGLANLSRLHPVLRKDADTVFARTVLDSDREQTVPIQFGYSDRVKVYLNGRLIYGGNNGYQTRDYRYLGTIGFFDAVYLPLTKGKNELWFAVSESFGGWGLLARLQKADGVNVAPE